MNSEAMCEDDGGSGSGSISRSINILEDRDQYIHQYLTSIFQISLANNAQTNIGEPSPPPCDDQCALQCLALSEVHESRLTFGNYSHCVFECLMNQHIEHAGRLVDRRFLPDRGSLFNHDYRVFDDDSNRIAYLFNCYCRLETVRDFAALVPRRERAKLKRYVIDQAALILVCPYANVRYAESATITPFVDLFHVLTQSIPWPSEYLMFAKKFFVDITDAIEAAAKAGNNEEADADDNEEDDDDDHYVSSLCDLSPDELNLEQIVKPIYDLLCRKFKSMHMLAAPFVDDIKFVHLLIASPRLAEIFIDLNSPPQLRIDSSSSSQQSSSSSADRTNTGNGGGGGGAQNTNDIFRSFLMNISSTLDGPNASAAAAAAPSSNSSSSSTVLTSRDSGLNSERHFHESLLGILLCNSPLPSPFSKPKSDNNSPMNFILSVFQGSEYEYHFFANPALKSPSEVERTELEIDDNLAKLRGNLTDVFYTLLKSASSVRAKTLQWIECCLTTFNGRSKLWANELLAFVGGSTSSNTSDGFVLNFSAVLLNLCKPFCVTPDSMVTYGRPAPDDTAPIAVNPKMLKVDPVYMGFAKRNANVNVNANTNNASDYYAPYLAVLNQEAVLINNRSSSAGGSGSGNGNATTTTGEDDKLTQYQPNFITKCFFATHKALHLGFRVIHERFHQVNQENSQLQRRVESLGLSSLSYLNRDRLSANQQEVLSRLDQNMTVTLSMKSTLIETNFINLLLEFYLATATWVNNLAICDSESEAAQSFRHLEALLRGEKVATTLAAAPAASTTPGATANAGVCLKWVPEFIIENIIDFMLFLRYFEVKPKILTLKVDLEPFLTMIVLFMGSQHRMRNPHLRAKMAEMLEALLPNVQTNIQPTFLESLYKRQYFIDELFPALLNVFVSIEISDETNNGDVVAFEQKFNYRRPMYVVFKYLCTLPDHQRKLAALAKFAERNMDSVQSPIFLRFINLLINDAIFLLDEGLSLMAKLREAQQERDSGAWQRESAQQRQQNEANFVHLGRLAKFHNFIGRDTIATLTTITDYVKSFFSHRILVDRMASMLNYFLHHLVGPNKRNFKVKQMNEYDFNPGELVKNICRIYVNLACRNPISVHSSGAGAGNASSGNGLPDINEKYEAFCLAICQDDRSYSTELLAQANDILQNRLGQPMLAEDIMSVDRTVKEVMLRQRKREIPLEDIPEEFLDPLMSTLMRDPVILPGSRKVLDRATISRHLLSDHTDPYTRTPLTMDMLIPDVETKRKIEEFIAAKLQALENDS